MSLDSLYIFGFKYFLGVFCGEIKHFQLPFDLLLQCFDFAHVDIWSVEPFCFDCLELSFSPELSWQGCHLCRNDFLTPVNFQCIYSYRTRIKTIQSLSSLSLLPAACSLDSFQTGLYDVTIRVTQLSRLSFRQK